MRPAYIVFALLLLAFMLPAGEAQGQFWKEWFGGKEKRRSRPPVDQPRKDRDGKESVVIKRQEIEWPASRIKTRYRVDVLLPLYLPELVKNDSALYTRERLPEKAAGAFGFYEGIKMASDSLSSMGYKYDIYIHDITQENLKPENLIRSRTLKGSDLIIGFLNSAQIPPIADFAKEERINFISSLSPSDAGVEDNVFFTMMQPGLESHVRHIRQVIAKKHPEAAVLVVYQQASADSQTARYFLEDTSYTALAWTNRFPAVELLGRRLDSNRTNVIIVPVLDVEAAEKLLSYLDQQFPNYRFEVFGMPSWKFMNSIRKADTLSNIGINFTTAYYFNPGSAAVQQLLNRYRKVFGGRPGEMVFMGYETFYWYAQLLQRYGTVFNNRYADTAGVSFTPLRIELQWDDQGKPLYNENKHLYLYRYQAGSYSVE